MKNATPSYWKSNEEIALLLTVRGCKSDVSRKVLANVEARIETQRLMGYKPNQ